MSLHIKYPEGVKFLHAIYSEQRNDLCLKTGLDGVIAFHVNAAEQLVAATQYLAGNHQFPLFSDSIDSGALYLSSARIGNYDTNRNGLIGTIDAAEWKKIREDESIDTMEELLVMFNALSGDTDVKGQIEKFKEFLSPYLITSENPEQKMRTKQVEQFKTFSGEPAPLMSWKSMAEKLSLNQKP